MKMNDLPKWIAAPIKPVLASVSHMIEAMQSPIGQIWPMWAKVQQLERKMELMQAALGRIEERQVAASSPRTVQDLEFQVSSQWGEDGILHYLTTHVAISSRTFIEFGVETFVEANCRWLLTQHNWSGLVLDGSEANIAAIKRDPIYWRHNLKAVQAFVTAEYINSLIEKNGLSGEVGILSVDVDGVDYWIWKAIDCVNPAIVVAEYNGLFGSERAVTVPYDPAFDRSKAHFSCSYYGASLGGLTALAREKGYALVASNSAGNNAFFVRRDLLNDAVREVTVTDAYVRRNFREARAADGTLAFSTFEEETAMIAHLPVVEVGG
jgi:hypothetical protein